jgi:hypothetical protein
LVRKHKLLVLFLIIILGFVIRLSFFIGNSFPLHDGGFFYVMIQDLISNHFILPAYSSYNHANIPFIYPPLGLYIVGLTEKLTGIDRLQLFRLFPLVISTLTIPVFWGLAKEILKDDWKSLAATAFYSILPTGYSWLILGGGVTRSFGALFGILALTWAIRSLNNGGMNSSIFGSIFCGLTVLSHPEWAWFIFYTIGLYAILSIINKNQRIIRRSIIIILGTSMIIVSWVVTILTKHEMSILMPLLDSGFSRWSDIYRLILLQWTEEKLVPIITLISIVGIISMVNRKNWFLAILLALTFVLQGRAADQKAVVPIALLAGEGIVSFIQFIYPRLQSIVRPKRNSIIGFGIIVYFLVYILSSTIISVSDFVKPLHEQQITSINWISQEIPQNSRILVISGEDWVQDNYSEWMSALTNQESISLILGYEWLPGFTERISLYDQIQREYFKGTKNLISWLNKNNIYPDYLILLKSEKNNHISETSDIHLEWENALYYPGIIEVFKNRSVLILDIRAVVK